MKYVIFLTALAILGCSKPLAKIDPPTNAILDVGFGQVRVAYQPAPPPYPPAAKAARIEGNVMLSLVVDKNGEVISETTISGPEELIEPTKSYWAKYKFYPFIKNGQPRIIRFSVLNPFRLP